ncbi:MAG: glycosyltransferase family 2 protein [Chitinivibrionia bacterium]|nr:glycosyltransferase family 2 protein [Chitinivibrionia bacterium]
MERKSFAIKIRYSSNPIAMNFIKKPMFLLICVARMFRLTKKSKSDYKAIHLHNEDIKDFKNALYQFSYSRSGFVSAYLNAYRKKLVKPVKSSLPTLQENDPILLCAVKDDLEKIKLQVEHHRKIGVKHFAYIDNMSKDGTFEWLKEQADVSLFVVNETFNATVKDAWRRQVADFLGYNRWYLVLDSDELFMYPSIETKNINSYIDFLESCKINSVLSPMIDMYPKGNLTEKVNSINEILNTYCYFDTDTYYLAKYFSSQWVNGGPRKRVFSNSPQLAKYSLIKLSKEMLIGIHQNYPYKYNFETKGAAAFLLHYKFFYDDIAKYKERAMLGVMNSGGLEYNQYLDALNKNPCTSFYYENSQKLNSSFDLMKINIIDKNFFEKFLGREVLPSTLTTNTGEFGKKERIIARWLADYPQIKQFVKKTYQLISWLMYKKNYNHKTDYSIRVIKDGNNESFWGYYDKTPLSPDGKYILFYSCKCPTNTAPKNNKGISVILQEFNTKKTLLEIPVQTYNWQQGCRVQWLSNDIFIFNDFDAEKNIYIARVWSAVSLSELKSFDKPVQDSYKTEYYFSLNYRRLMSLCPDYGYRTLPMLNTKELTDIANDGIWKVNYNNGETTLLVDMKTVCSIGQSNNISDALHSVNHIMISPDGDKFIFIHRYYVRKKRFDRLFLADSKTGNLKLLSDYGMVSHCFWADNKNVLAYLRSPDGTDAYNKINTDTGNFTKIIGNRLNKLGDGHPNVFGECFVADTYPDKARMQHLFLFNLKTSEEKELGEFFHGLKYSGETRCDLHPRFSPDGKYVFFDSVYSGKRQLYCIAIGEHNA